MILVQKLCSPAHLIILAISALLRTVACPYFHACPNPGSVWLGEICDHPPNFVESDHVQILGDFGYIYGTLGKMFGQKGFSAKDLGRMDIKRLILTAAPDYETTNVPKSEWRKKFHDLVTSNPFDAIIMSCIMLNMVQMACLHENQSSSFTWFLDFTNYIFTTVFIIEACLKLTAFGSSYFDNGWNKFDFFVVVSSLFDIALGFLENNSLEWLSVGPQLARVMRVLRVTRVLRLAGKA